MRRVISSDWTREGDVLLYHVEANSFLRHMVRTMVAAMVEAGRGNSTPTKLRRSSPGRSRARTCSRALGRSLSH